MNEATLTQAFHAALRGRGFLVFKHSDRFIKGIPDTSASRNHTTVWLEFKAVRVGAFIAELDWGRIIRPGDQVQLANMVVLEQKARAAYVLFQIGQRGHQTHVVLPSRVATSVRDHTPVLFGPPASMSEIEAWLERR